MNGQKIYFSAIWTFLAILICVTIFVEKKRDAEWIQFKTEHKCVSIGKHNFGVGKGGFAKTGYVCDDNITYWRD